MIMGKTARIVICGLRKMFRGSSRSVLALDEVDLDVLEGDFFVLLGPSGSGKTTLLRCVAGLEKPDAGEIILDSHVVSSPERGLFVPPEDRELGMVFQSYAIWPHMTVYENIAFPLMNRKRRLPRSEVKRRVDHALAAVQLSGLEDRPAPFLSGGQQQRVALARALAVEPKVMLMDEPLSNLDARLREEVRDEIRTLAKRLGITILYVTHDQVEAMAIADKIAVMHQGQVLEVGGPEQLYLAPKDRTVCEFFGLMNQMAGNVRGGATVLSEIGALALAKTVTGESEVTVAIRPEDVIVSDRPTGLVNEFAGEFTSRVFLGDVTMCTFLLNGKLFRYKTARFGSELPVGSPIYARFPPERLIVFQK